ncbi:hypothetical protein FRC01_000998 [Tulasnella sp. 417]|nr:hypothetical protein FRC01_000998 [Tulasnella sp. 417]
MRSDSTTNAPDARVILRHLAFSPGLRLQELQARWPELVPRLDDAVSDVLDRQKESLKSFSHQAFNLNEQLRTSISQLPNLVKLELKFIDVTTRADSDFNNFCNAVASSCPGLETSRFSIPSGPRSFTFHAFRPLMRIGGLRKFFLESGDLALKEKDFQEMGESWQSLERLSLPDSRIPLHWFAGIAKYFSCMLEEINVDIQVPEDLDPDCAVPKAFKALKRISYVEAVSPKALEAVISLLRRLVSPNTVVECAEWMEQPLKEVTGNSVHWKGERRRSKRLFSPDSPGS